MWPRILFAICVENEKLVGMTSRIARYLRRFREIPPIRQRVLVAICEENGKLMGLTARLARSLRRHRRVRGSGRALCSLFARKMRQVWA